MMRSLRLAAAALAACLLATAVPAATVASKASIAAVGATDPIVLFPNQAQPALLPPSVLCLLTTGASLTYTVEVTGDGSNGDFSTATWFPLDASATGLTASANFKITSMVTAVRVRVTSYTSGSVTFQVVR